MAKEKKESGSFLKQDVLYKGVILEKGTKIEEDHPEFADFEKQGRLVNSKALALSKPGAVEDALGDVSAELAEAKATITELETTIAEQEKDLAEAMEVIKTQKQEIADLKKANK